MEIYSRNWGGRCGPETEKGAGWPPTACTRQLASSGSPLTCRRLPPARCPRVAPRQLASDVAAHYISSMRTIGLLGGMSWESTALYYQHINSGIKLRLGGLHSAELVLVSIDFAPLEQMQAAGDWEAAGRLLAEKAARAEAAGAELLLLCTNTMHKVAPAVEAAVKIPLIHIADATAAAIKAAGLTRVGLLGTRFTMEQDFYAGRLQELHGLEVLTPEPADREIVHRVIYEELVLGTVRDESRAEFVRITQQLAESGAQGVILGCTEIGMLLSQADIPLPLFDTTALHAEAAVTAAVTAASAPSAASAGSADRRAMADRGAR